MLACRLLLLSAAAAALLDVGQEALNVLLYVKVERLVGAALRFIFFVRGSYNAVEA